MKAVNYNYEQWLPEIFSLGYPDAFEVCDWDVVITKRTPSNCGLREDALFIATNNIEGFDITYQKKECSHKLVVSNTGICCGMLIKIPSVIVSFY